MKFNIMPVESENYEGRQWGYIVERDEAPFLHVTTGGTGTCWNVEHADDMADNGVIPLHVCNLDELIRALEFLRDSEANAAHVARWS